MLECRNDVLSFSFPEVHPEAKMGISFQRTLRIPDDGKEYPLPPGLGTFPLRHVEDFKDRVPEKWLKRGGVMAPLFQSEALWISFQPHRVRDHGVPYPFAVKVSAGKRSAVTGRPWSQSLREKDYVVVPEQPWLDGYVVEEGLIRQFVAMPLGMGLTVESQLTGKEEFGGIQIEVIPMQREHFERRFPKRPPMNFLRSMNLSCSFNEDERGEGGFESFLSSDFLAFPAAAAAPAAAMGLGAGGKMKQQIFEDPYGISEWHDSEKNRCFVHLANSFAWEAITTQKPPPAPSSAAVYSQYGLPWFDHYRDDQKALGATEKLGAIKSILALGFQKGLTGLIADNGPVEPKIVTTVTPKSTPKSKKSPSAVRDGTWK